ncbi:MAG: 50S ribosomal protein L15 [bacterium]|nr:50S ribosomal protein L15 [bacterium]
MTERTDSQGLHNLKNPGRKLPQRIGRGTGSGSGTTAGRGTKGQNSRAGGGVHPRFEGGHTPLFRRTPKLRGFKSRHPKAECINLDDVARHFKKGQSVKPADLVKHHLISAHAAKIKLLADGEMPFDVTVYVDLASVSAVNKIEKAGGKVIMPKPKPKVVKKAKPQ